MDAAPFAPVLVPVETGVDLPSVPVVADAEALDEEDCESGA